MEIALIIIAYILNVFLNRWLNYIVFKTDRMIPLWFLSLFVTIPFLLVIIIDYATRPNWFTGRHWDKK